MVDMQSVSASIVTANDQSICHGCVSDAKTLFIADLPQKAARTSLDAEAVELGVSVQPI